MSRHSKAINENITVITGSDHAVGNFIQVIDKRYRESDKDEQGKGYVLDYDNMFGFTTNLIGLTKADLPFSDEKIIKRCDKFAKTL